MAFVYKLEYEDGTVADPPTLSTATPSWHPGDTIPLARDKFLRLLDVPTGPEPDDDPLLVVERPL